LIYTGIQYAAIKDECHCELHIEHVLQCHITDMVDISIITPVYNAAAWLDECLQSVLKQTFPGSVELSVYNDASSDGSDVLLESWRSRLKERDITMVLSTHSDGGPKGVGYAKNAAIRQSSGEYLCFLDADDVMMPDRLTKQYRAAQQQPYNTIIGCRVERQPAGSTERFIKWANSMREEQLYTQAYTSHGPTLLMPTWFCSRKLLNHVGYFNENGKGSAEDLLFFYAHLALGGLLHRVPETLLIYRYHPQQTTFSVAEETIWNLRVGALQVNVLDNWSEFTIWNAGKQGRKLYRSLSPMNRSKVIAFCDVDEKKISKGVYIYEESEELCKPRVQIVHFSVAKPPLIICVKQDLTGGEFEKNLESLNLIEGKDYFHFN